MTPFEKKPPTHLPGSIIEWRSFIHGESCGNPGTKTMEQLVRQTLRLQAKSVRLFQKETRD